MSKFSLVDEEPADARRAIPGAGSGAVPSSWAPSTPSWIVLALLLVATVASTWASSRAIEAARALRFELQTARIAEQLADIMRDYQSMLRASAGLFEAFRPVTAEAWAKYVAALELDTMHPGVQGLGFASVIAASDLSRHVEVMRQSNPYYELRPAGPRDTYTSIVMLEPRDRRNARAIGFDMFSEPIRRAAMETARDTGTMQMTTAITLVQEDSNDVQRGVLVYYPVYAAGMPHTSTEQRRRAVIGYVYAAFRMQTLYEKAVKNQLRDLLADVSVRVYDRPGAEGGALLFDSALDYSATGGGSSRLERPATVSTAGQTWQLHFESRPEFTLQTESWTPWIIAIIGTTASILITLISMQLAAGRQAAINAQERLSAEVARRTQAQAELEQANLEVRISNQELIHRVKNMMSVITSIAAQTARYTPDPAEFVRVFRERLAALGRVHDFLKPNPQFRPSLAELVPVLLAPYHQHGGRNVEIDGSAIDVTQSSAVMISLVISELATNAVKYGTWRHPGGLVRVSWSVHERQDGSRMLRFSWREEGGPKVASPTKKGYGSNVLKFAIEQGLKGSFVTQYEPSGLHCTWSMPWTKPVSRQQEF